MQLVTTNPAFSKHRDVPDLPDAEPHSQNDYNLPRSATDLEQQIHTEYMQAIWVGTFPEILREKYTEDNAWTLRQRQTATERKRSPTLPFSTLWHWQHLSVSPPATCMEALGQQSFTVMNMDAGRN